MLFRCAASGSLIANRFGILRRKAGSMSVGRFVAPNTMILASLPVIRPSQRLSMTNQGRSSKRSALTPSEASVAYATSTHDMNSAFLLTWERQAKWIKVSGIAIVTRRLVLVAKDRLNSRTHIMPLTSWSPRLRSRMKLSISSMKMMLGCSFRANEKRAATSLFDSPNHCDRR